MVIMYYMEVKITDTALEINNEQWDFLQNIYQSRQEKEIYLLLKEVLTSNIEIYKSMGKT